MRGDRAEFVGLQAGYVCLGDQVTDRAPDGVVAPAGGNRRPGLERIARRRHGANVTGRAC
ncbi:MAG: hypothetical protein QOF83_1716 [Solirubrobacteraceae bacterium]|nr:hypothetical protein [Solirubrobacteraceae bacterium]